MGVFIGFIVNIQWRLFVRKLKEYISLELDSFSQHDDVFFSVIASNLDALRCLLARTLMARTHIQYTRILQRIEFVCNLYAEVRTSQGRSVE